MNLFRLGDFTLHSGGHSRFKIDCDSLVNEDWKCLAQMAAERLPRFTHVEGVLHGGIQFARALEIHRSFGCESTLLIVDDVWTTGASMEQQRGGRDAIGMVVFSRGTLASWVKALFVLQ